MASAIPTIALNDGRTIPQLGFGVFQVPPAETRAAVETAIGIGYRHIDTAQMYGNESGVGEAVAASGIDRSEFFITSKLNNAAHEPDEARRAFEGTLKALGMDYVDLFLIHWPLPTLYGGDFVQTWRTLEEFYRSGQARSIGVSNFTPHQLGRLRAETQVRPAVNQIEIHPYLLNEEARAYNTANEIANEAYSPIAQGEVLTDPAIEAVAVWDTVAFHKSWFSTSWAAKLLGIEREQLEFHNAELSPKIKYGFHALALDETRNPFKPTLWQMPKQAPAANGVTSDGSTWRLKEMKQVWFSGRHSDVGGGVSQTWLSNITLGWMVAMFEKRKLLAFDQSYLLDQSLPPASAAGKDWETSKGATSTDQKGVRWLVDKATRNLPLLSSCRTPLSLTNTNESIHSSIEARNLGRSTGSKGATRWSCGALTGDRDGETWQVKSKVKAFLGEDAVEGVEQTLRGRIRAPVNSCVKDLNLRNRR